MTTQRPCMLRYDDAVREHLRWIDRKYHVLIRHTIEEQLTYEPAVKTRNRKPLIRPSTFGATWELRFGPENCFRVFYRLAPERALVSILAIGIKKGNRLFIGGKEFIL